MKLAANAHMPHDAMAESIAGWNCAHMTYRPTHMVMMSRRAARMLNNATAVMMLRGCGRRERYEADDR